MPKPHKRKKTNEAAGERGEQFDEDVIQIAGLGGITLVIGAGVSIPRGVPNWNDLALTMWRSAFGTRKSPWSRNPLANQEVSPFLPIIFELVYRKLGEENFVALLQEHLYSAVRFPNDDRDFASSNESLAVIARLIHQEYKRKAKRRIDAVITLNADDLIENAVNTVAGRTPDEAYRPPAIVRTISRGTHGAISSYSARPILIYHLHGFLPSNHGLSSHVPYASQPNQMLVFTDTQYWSMSASGLTFANRIMSSALSEGRCIFIGLSMNDINLLRWLALRTIERDRDILDMGTQAPRILRMQDRRFARHYWIRPSGDDPGGFLSEFLKQRGIKSCEIEAWTGKHFRKLIEAWFPKKSS